MRKYTVPVSMSVEYFLGDHLGSTSITTDNAGTKVSEMRYKPWGEVRYSWTSAPVTTPSYKLSAYTFTGQYSYMDDPSTSGVTEGFGLMFYNARWYDPSLSRFAQADTIVPGGVQGLDRYAYVNNSPLMYTDPSGHRPCDDEFDCSQRQYKNTIVKINWKKIIEDKFGVTLSDGGAANANFENPDSHGRIWGEQNTALVYQGLSVINNALGGALKAIIGSSDVTFTLNTHPPVGSSYFGETSGTTIDFYADSLTTLENIYHEFGHVLNSLPGRDNIFSDQLDQLSDPSFVTDGYISETALLNGAGRFIQAREPLVTEQWADVFLNYMSGNINQNSPEGQAMYNFISGVLATDVSGKTR